MPARLLSVYTCNPFLVTTLLICTCTSACRDCGDGRNIGKMVFFLNVRFPESKVKARRAVV